MPRGRQYYDPIVSVPGKIPGEADYTRIELFPAGAESLGRLPQDIGKWMGRRIGPDGSVVEEAPGDFSHDRALTQATELWPGLTVYELNAENEDSTWDGTGPSPRIWQNSSPETGAPTPPAVSLLASGPSHEPVTSGAGDEHFQPPVALHVLPIPEPGTYVLLHDIRELLESWAVGHDIHGNPSAALALRDAVDMLKDVG